MYRLIIENIIEYINIVNIMIENIDGLIKLSDKIKTFNDILKTSFYNNSNYNDPLVFLIFEYSKINDKTIDIEKFEKMILDILNALFNLHSKNYIYGRISISNIVNVNDNFVLLPFNIKNNLGYLKLKESTELDSYNRNCDILNLKNFICYVCDNNNFKSKFIEQLRNDIVNLNYDNLKDKYKGEGVREGGGERGGEREYLYNDKYIIKKIIHIKYDSVVLKIKEENGDRILKICPSTERSIISKMIKNTILTKMIGNIEIIRGAYIMNEYDEITISDSNYKKILKETLYQLYLLHSNSILHNDIKICNLMYNRNINRYIIIDYGMSEYIKDIGYNELLNSEIYKKYVKNSLKIEETIPLLTEYSDIYMLCKIFILSKDLSDESKNDVNNYIENIIINKRYNYNYNLRHKK